MSEDSVEPLWVDDILCGILELTDKSGRLLSPPFRVLQPKEVGYLDALFKGLLYRNSRYITRK